LTGSFVAETFNIAGTPRGTLTTEQINGAMTQSDNADYQLLAANNQRARILAVPGSGKIRGIWNYKDVWYAFRDNAGGTAGDMYKSTAGGWVKVTFGFEIQFTTAVGQINVGDTITGNTSGATAVVIATLLRTGTWTVAGTGTLIIGTIVGTFQNAESLKVGGVGKVTSSSLATAITRAPGGANGILEFVNYNFSGSTVTQKMYGADGVNLGFEFDGTNYIPIRTGMTSDTPYHVMAWKNYLMYSYLGSVQISGVGTPYTWTINAGAVGEIALGENVTGFLPQTGNSGGSSIAIFTKGKTYILYLSSSAAFTLVPSISELGASQFTAQQVGNDAFVLSTRGIQKLITTLTYGDFNFASVSHLVQKILTAKLGLETVSTTLKSKNQYRLYFNDNTGLAVGLTGDEISGIMYLNYGIPVRCMTTTTLSTGIEQTCFGSDDGSIYMDHPGTVFDGGTIEAWIRLAFDNVKSPQVRKTFRRVILDMYAVNYAQVNITYDLGYGNPNVLPSAASNNRVVNGGGGYWDQVIWDVFTWDAQIVSTTTLALAGTEKNISYLFYSNRAQDMSHVLQGVTTVYSPRRLER